MAALRAVKQEAKQKYGGGPVESKALAQVREQLAKVQEALAKKEMEEEIEKKSQAMARAILAKQCVYRALFVHPSLACKLTSSFVQRVR